MAIDISKSHDGLFYDFNEEIILDKAILGDRLAEFVKPAIVKGTYIPSGSDVYINAYIDVEIAFKCDKCLDDTTRKLHIKFDTTYSLVGSGEGDYSYNNFLVDFTEAVNEQVMLNLPSRVLCKPDCKGLCTICGARLNERTCDCVADKAEKENPFSALKNYFNS